MRIFGYILIFLVCFIAMAKYKEASPELLAVMEEFGVRPEHLEQELRPKKSTKITMSGKTTYNSKPNEQTGFMNYRLLQEYLDRHDLLTRDSMWLVRMAAVEEAKSKSLSPKDAAI